MARSAEEPPLNLVHEHLAQTQGTNLIFINRLSCNRNRYDCVNEVSSAMGALLQKLYAVTVSSFQQSEVSRPYRAQQS